MDNVEQTMNNMNLNTNVHIECHNDMVSHEFWSIINLFERKINEFYGFYPNFQYQEFGDQYQELLNGEDYNTFDNGVQSINGHFDNSI